jgi:CRISPR-associated protein Cas2
MFTIICYDIVNDRRRTKVMQLLKGYGTRVQYSVFECYLSAQELARVGRQLRRLIDPTRDSVRCYRLDAVAVERTQIVGIGRVTPDETYYLVRDTSP